jgi:hypothetical protein
MNRTPTEFAIFLPALAAQTIAPAGTANGNRIVFPAQLSEQLVIVLNYSAGAGLTAFSARLEGSNDNGTTWAPVKQNDGLTDLTFSGAKFLPAGAYDGGVAVGSIQPQRGKYRDYRLSVTSVVGGAVGAKVGATAILFPARRQAAGVEYPGGLNQYGQQQPAGGYVDEWLNLFLPTGS